MIEAPQTIYELEPGPNEPATERIGLTADQMVRLVSAGKLYLKQTIHVYAPMPGVDVDKLLDEL